MNTKKCLIAVAAIFITAVMQAQQAPQDLTAEQQLAQRKAELDAREKALDRREKILAQKEKAVADSAPRSRETAKAKVRHEQAKDEGNEEQAKAARAEKKLHEPFFQRLDEAFLEQLGTPAYTPPDPNAPNPRRIPPAPFDSPPFPNGDWQIGGTAGTAIIGDPGELAPYPLMQAIYEGPGGQAWKDSKVQLYGWVNFSGNISTSHPSKTSENGNFPLVYDIRPNRMELNQFVLYLERLPNEAQTDHIDWGFRIAALYGLDYRFTFSRGWFSDQLLKHNSYYGVDTPMVYFDLYIPYIFQGMNITIGRIISEPDIEAQLAPNNLMATHSLLYGFDDYCHEGIFTTTKINAQWTLQLGIDGGTDVAIWQDDPGRQVTGDVMIQWIAPNQMDSIYAGANSFNNGKFGYNNLQQYVGTWTHKFNDKIYTATEAWYMYMNDAIDHPTKEVPFQSGSFPVRNGYAPEWAVLNYTMFRLSGNAFFTVRNEYMNDKVGSRTGFATQYSEHAIGITYWPDKLITIRPELRFDHSYDVPAYNLGTRKNQFAFTTDVIFHF
ncbi:MAG TPA: outer membrane beta-barrel protein [Chthoniobacterales bacterium]|nr:outer membrane beta-barrel protein [Chthoniobacterales bacterium]